MSSRGDARRQSQPRGSSRGSSGTDLGWPLPMRASGGGSPGFGAAVAASSGHGPAWRRGRDDVVGYGRYGTERRGGFSEQESLHREHIRSSHWQPQPLRLPPRRRADAVRPREAEYRRLAADGDTGEGFEYHLGEHPKNNTGESSEEGWGPRSTFRGGIYAPSPHEERDDTAAHAAVQHLERLRAELQLLNELESMSRAGAATPDRDMSQCVHYSPRDHWHKRTAQPGLPPPPEAPEAEAARHHAMAECVCRLLTETGFQLSALSIVSDTTSGSAPGAMRQWEPRTSAAVAQPRESSLVQEIPPGPRPHRRHVPAPAPAQQGAQAQLRTPPSEPQQQQGQQEPPSYSPPPGSEVSKTRPAGGAKPQTMATTKPAFSKRASKRGEGGGGGGADAGARKSHHHHHHHRHRHVLQEPGGRPAETTAVREPQAAAAHGTADGAGATPHAEAPRQPCAGCHKSKRRAEKLIRTYGFCFRCLRKHLVDMGELRSCAECRRLRVKEDYFLYDKYGAKQKETLVCAFCRWRKKGKCGFLCGRPD